jgi:hypothetical protein
MSVTWLKAVLLLFENNQTLKVAAALEEGPDANSRNCYFVASRCNNAFRRERFAFAGILAYAQYNITSVLQYHVLPYIAWPDG